MSNRKLKNEVFERIYRGEKEINERLGSLSMVDTGLKRQDGWVGTEFRTPTFAEKIEAIEKYLGIEYTIGNGYGYRKKPAKKGKKAEDNDK